MNRIYSTRCKVISLYMIEKRCTIREAARFFKLSKSTVHLDVTERIANVCPELYEDVRKLLEKNKRERSARGAMATKRKYAEARNKLKNQL